MYWCTECEAWSRIDVCMECGYILDMHQDELDIDIEDDEAALWLREHGGEG